MWNCRNTRILESGVGPCPRNMLLARRDVKEWSIQTKLLEYFTFEPGRVGIAHRNGVDTPVKVYGIHMSGLA